MSLAVLVNLLGSLQYTEDTLLGQCRSKDDREIHEWSHTVADGILEGIDHLLVLLLYQVPLVDYHHQTLVVLLDQLEDVHILGLDTTGGIQHQDADITVLDGTDGAHHGIEFQVLAHLVLSADTGSIYQVEVEAELIVTGIDTVTGSTGNLGNDVSILTDEGIDDTALACVRTTYHSETRNILLDIFLRIILKLVQYDVEQVTRTTTCCSTDTLRITQAQLVELGSLIILSTVIHLVGNKDHRQLGTTQDESNILIPVGQTGVYIYQEEHQVGLFCSYQHLLADSILENVI